MKILRPSEDVLVVKADDSPFAVLWLLIGVLCATWGAYLFFTLRSPFHEENFQGALAGTVMGLIGFLALYERGTFTFDRGKRLVTWSRRRALKERSGSLTFGEIRSVIYQSPIGDHGVPSRRVVLVTSSDELPLSTAYAPDGDDRIKSLAESLGKFVAGEKSAPDVTRESVRAAILAGRKTEAIRILRQEERVGLNEAMRIVEEMNEAERDKTQ